eukprot:TRINITY_DN23754_c0_g2_i1.p1 TRINITY_DN23754_c0_g2~~TRINITY_DN23754_c0_g2_i1.p1  ORF type:complete len:3440 (+),score=1336.32 TRINITY_DN23754_c0_g2_i1:156-10475(+)
MGRKQGGDGASSQGSGSQGASSSIASSSVGKKGPPGASLFTVHLPIVPLFTSLDAQYPRRLVYAGIAVDACQLLGWAINPNQRMGGILTDIGRIVYATHLPLWDRAFGGLSYTIALGPFWLCVAAVWGLWGTCIHFARSQGTPSGWMHQAARVCLHSVCTWLFIPISSWLMAFMVCDEDDRVWAIGRECGGALQLVHVVVGALALVPLWVGAFLVQSMLFTTDCRSRHFLARSHSRCDKLVVLWRMGTVLAYHLLHARKLGTWFALYVAVTCFLIGVAFAAVMPYYRERANQVFTAAYMVVAWFALIVFLGSFGHLDESFTEMQADAVFALGFAIPIVHISEWLATARVSTLYRTHLENFVAGHVMTTPELIPAGLEQGGHYQPMDAIETELPDALWGDREDEVWRDGQENFLVPKLGRIWLETDVEVATRFVLEYTVTSGQKPSPQMTLAGARLFAKGITLHKRSDLLPFQLALFLCTHNRERTGVLRFTLHHLLDGSVARTEAALSVRYQTHKLGTWVRAAIGWKDNSHIKLWRSAQKLHREALGQMGTFWARLLGAKVDTVQLAVIANGITQKRQQANSEFISVLGATREPQVVLSYASFLEQVMLDTDAAKACRDQVSDTVDTRSAVGVNTMGGREDVLSWSKMSEQLNSSSDATREHLSNLTRTMNTTFFILFILVAGFFVYEMLLWQEKDAILESTHAAGRARMLTQQAGYQALFLCAQEDRCGRLRSATLDQQTTADTVITGDQTSDAAERATAVRLELQRINKDLQATHGLLTFDKHKATHEPLVEFNKWPSVAVRVTFEGVTEDELPFTSGYNRYYSLWNLGYDMVEVLRRLGSTNTSALHRVSAYHWVIDNIDGPITEVFNRSVQLRTDKAEETWFSGIVILTALFVCSLIIIQIVYMVLILNFQQIEQSKLGALNLFTLIPKAELAKLHHRARRLANTFDIGSTKLQESDDSDDHSEEQETARLNAGPGEGDQLDEDDAIELDDDERDAEMGTMVPLCLVLICGLGLAALAMTLACIFTFPEITKESERRRDKYELILRIQDHQSRMRTYAQSFVQFGDLRELVGFVEELNGFRIDHIEQELHEKSGTELALQLLTEMRTDQDQLVDLAKTALRLGASAYNHSESVTSSLTHHTWQNNVSLPRIARGTGALVLEKILTRQHALNNTDHDLKLPATDKVLLARSILFGEEYEHYLRRWRNLLRDLWREYDGHADDEIDKNRFDAYVVSLVVIYAIIGLCGVMYVARGITHGVLLRDPLLKASCAIFFACAFTSLGLAIKIHSDLPSVTGKIDSELEQLRQMNQSMSQVMHLTDSARYFATSGSFEYYSNYWAAHRYNDIGIWLSHAVSESSKLYGEIISDLEKLHDLNVIAITLSAWAHGMSTLEWSRGEIAPEIRAATWDFRAEQDMWDVKARFPEEYLWYSTPGEDITQPPDWQHKVARATVYNHRYEEILERCLGKMRAAGEQRRGEVERGAQDAYDYANALLTGSVALCIAQVLSLLVYVTNLIVTLMQVKVATRGGASTSQLTESKGLVRRSQLSLILVVICLLGMYVLGIIGLNRFRGHVPRVDVASAREWTVARSLVMATRYAYTPEDLGDPRLLRSRLADSLNAIERYRTELYHGETLSSGDYNGVGLSAAQDNLLFGHDVTFTLPSCTPDADRAEFNNFLSRGADIALRFWVESARAMLEMGDSAELVQRLNQLRTDAIPVLYSLQQSTDEYVTGAQDDVSAWSRWFIVVLAVTLAVIAIEFLFIFRPMTGRLLKQDTSTKLMLNMIPQLVRDSVPEIQEFLDSGLTMQAGDPEEAITEAINEMSTTPIVAIDMLGTVIKFTQAAESAFGYAQSEVVGNNVRLLMPQQFAVNHDSYMRAYQRTGVKKIIGILRKVQALRKDQTTFPISILVREYRNQSESTYIGVLRDLSSELELEATMRLNQTIQAASALPMICIDNLATVSVFNNAAQNCFGFAEEEVIGQNVNMLMPDSISRQHDGYLAAYMKTGKAHIIGTTRRVQAQRKNGQLFPADVTVREVKHNSGSGSSSLFLGFLRDVTGDLATEYQHKVNDAVSNLSPIPIICTYANGEIVLFSTAAERVWGWKSDEVRGKNVKMLQTDEIADAHDAWLEAYARTKKRTIIGKATKQKAKHKDGTVFHIEITVNEVQKAGLPPIFVAFLRDITNEYREAINAEVNKTIANVSSVPLILLSQEGTIKLFNIAAQSEFKVQAHQVIGKNIKCLQPASVAEHHDGYLSTYLRTGVKRVIGTTRQSFGKRWDGSEFPIELTVHEVISQIDGRRTFVGYVRNIADDIRLQTAFRINECVSDLSIVPILAIDQIGSVMRWSRAAVTTWGYTEEEVMGKNIKMIMPESIAVRHDGYLAAYRRTGVKNVIDSTRTATALRKNGEEFPVQISVKEVQGAEGQPNSYIGFARDLTGELALARSRTIAQGIAKASSIPMLTITPFGMMQQMNWKACQVFGVEEEDVLGKNIKMLMPEKYALRHDEFLANYRKTGIKTVIDTTRRVSAIGPEGEFPIEIAVKEVLSDEFEPIYVGYLWNISEQLQIEQANQMSDAVADMSTVGLIAIDYKGTVLKYSRAAHELFGYPPSEVVGQNVKMLQTPEVAVRHDGFLVAYLKTEVKNVIDTTRRVTAQHKEGTQIPVEISVKEVKRQDRPPTFIGYVRDARNDNAVEVSKLISATIADMSTVPIVMINSKGTVELFNLSGERAWGYTASEVVGKNIKLTLMPDNIAKDHDSFLERYLRTGKKHVVDTTRRVTAKAKSGEAFPIEIAVRELKSMNHHLFIAYARELREELALKELQEMNEAIMESSLVPLISINPVGTIELFVESACTTFGWTKEEIYGKNLKLLMPDNIAIHHDGYLARYASTGVKHVIDTTRRVRGKRKNGSTFPAEVSVREVKKEGLDTHYVGYVRDVSEQYVIEMNNSVAEAIRVMSSMGLIAITETGTIMKWNPAAERIFGYNDAETVGQNVKMLQPERIASQHDAILLRYKQTRIKHVVGTTRRVEGMRKDGVEVPIEITVREVRNEQDGTNSFVAYIRDMSDEAALSQATAINNAISNLSTIPIICITPIGTIVKYSAAAVQAFQWEVSEALDSNVKMLMPQETADRHDFFLRRYLETGVKHVIDHSREVTAQRKDGTKFTVQITVREVKSQRGLDSVYLGYVRDITDEIEEVDSRTLSNTVKDLITIPVIAMSPDCMVEVFNKASEALFGYDRSEVLGKNINQLQPEHIAINHDGYVQRYLEDGVRRVIDNTRQLMCRNKSGVFFTCTVTVREVKDDDTHIFIGYLKDMRETQELDISARLGDTVSALALSPLVQIGPTGEILKFNAAAERAFGFPVHQVQGKDVGILMPDTVADKHKGYLSGYLAGTKKKFVVDNPEGVVVQAETRQGDHFEARLRVKEVRDKNTGQVILFIGALKLSK